MPQNLIWSTQPIFISSTFSDMNAERDVLRDIVTLDLQDILNERRVRLEPIDFRWGIDTSDEKEKEQKELMVLKVCLEDIDRSDPFFIGLIGDRYGWVPPEKRMKDAEKEKNFTSKLKDKSVTALEIEYGVLASKKQLKRSFFFFREPLPYDEMPEEVKILYRDSEPENQNRLKELKEEIVKSIGEDKVFTYKAGWDSTTNKVNKNTGLEDFKKKVTEILWQEIDAETKARERTRPKTWEEEEQIYLQDFIADRVISFEGREDVINKLKEFALSDADHDNIGKCIAGESGSGKSALIAKLFVELSEEKEKGKDIILLAHAAGISLRSNSLENMLTIWIKELAKELSIDVSEHFEQSEEKKGGLERQLTERISIDGVKTKEKSKFEDLKNLFANLLTQAAVNKRVVVLVDALNQFDRTEQAKHLSWLPDLIPANSKFIFTAIPGAETENLSKRKGITVEKLEEIKEDDARKIIKALCDRYHKTFNKEAAEILLKKQKEDGSFAYSNPLWLTMVIDDFLLMDEDDFGLMKGLEGDTEQKLTQLLIRSAEKIPPDVEGMYQYVFKRCRKFGEEFVNEVLSYIGISRNGLRESDLESLIEENENIKWEPLNFASFRKYLRNHIIQKGALGLWDFRHVKARESLMKGILKDENDVTKLHKKLSLHLDKLKEEDPLRLSEIIWHLFKCDEKRKAAEIYGGNWVDHPETGGYSITIRDMLMGEDHNADWLCTMISSEGITDEIRHNIVNNVLSNLDKSIKDFVQLDLRLKIFEQVLAESSELLKLNTQSFDYLRDKYISNSFIGDIQKAMGDITSALENYRNASDTLKELQELNPGHSQIGADLAISYSRLGEIYGKMGQLEDSLKFFNDFNRLSELLHKTYPQDISYKNVLAISYEKLGEIYEKMGQLEDSLKFFNDFNRLSEELHKTYPQDESYKNVLAISYEKIGGIYEKIGQLENALKFYNDVTKLFDELHKTNPQDLSFKNGLAISYERLGGIYEKMGQLEDALKFCEDRSRLSEELHKTNPQEVSLKNDLAISYEKLGGIYEKMGQFENALKFYNDVNALFEKLHKIYPQEVSFKKGLASSYSTLGGIYEKMGQLEDALKFFHDFNRLIEELHKTYPQEVSFKNGLAISYERLGGIYEKTGQLEDALKFYKDRSRLSEELHKTDIQEVSFKYSLAVSYGMLGKTYEKMGQLEDALKFYKYVNKLFEKLHTTYPHDVSFKYSLAVSYERLGMIYEKMGQLEDALKFYKDSSRLSEELHKTDPQDISFKKGLAISYEKLGGVYEKMGQLEDTLKFYKEYNRFNEELHKTYPQDVSFKNGLAISYERLGVIYEKMGQLEDALKFYKDYNIQNEELHTNCPQDISFKFNLAASYQHLGRIYETSGQLEEALNFYKDVYILFEDLHTMYPQDVSYKNGLGISYSKLGGVYEKMGQLEDALKIYKYEIILFEDLHKTYPQDVSFKNCLAISYCKLAGVLIQSDRSKAINLYERAEKYWKELSDDFPEYYEFQKFLLIVQKDLAKNSTKQSYEVIEKKDVHADELLNLAEQSYNKKQWEGAETLFRKLLEGGEPIDIVGPKIFECILNAHPKLSDHNKSKLNDILDQLDANGNTEIVNELKKHLEERTGPEKKDKKGWRFWE